MLTASILAVGTELTTGQITNNNASWISKMLKNLGIPTMIHLTVPDNRLQIIDALNYCAKNSSLLIVTGGLGPTSDDFTRDMISDWTNKPLEFDTASWEQLQKLMSSRGVTVRESHKQQCFFPHDCHILTNSLGTANAFRVETTHQGNDIRILALPGPPAEIAAIWKEHVQPWLEPLSFHIDKLETESWDILGAAESEIAFRVESIYLNAPVELGYRIHLPYVEFKVTYKASDKAKIISLIEKTNSVLENYITFRNGEDPAEKLTHLLKIFSDVHLEDSVTDGRIYQRLQPYLKETIKSQLWTVSNHHKPVEDRSNEKSAQPQSNFLHLKLKKLSTGSIVASLILRDQQFNKIIDLTKYNKISQERSLKVLTEECILFWYQSLSSKGTTEN